MLGWFQSYLDGRTQYVRRGTAYSTVIFLLCGVPRESALGTVRPVRAVYGGLAAVGRQTQTLPTSVR